MQLPYGHFSYWSDSSPEVQDCTEQRVLRIYRGPDFLAVVWFFSSPVPQARPAAHKRTEKERHLAEEGCGGKAKPYDIEKVWSSMNHSIFPGTEDLSFFLIAVAQGVRQRIENGDLSWGRKARIRCRNPEQSKKASIGVLPIFFHAYVQCCCIKQHVY
jgi:hypothetical protein